MVLKVQRAKNKGSGNCQYAFVVAIACLLIREEKKTENK